MMAIYKLSERCPAQLSADHYRRHRNKLVEKGTVKKDHEDSTKENIYGVMKKWTQ
jgi:hypothetical protein